MKTSNIILLSFLGLILIWITVALFSAKNFAIESISSNTTDNFDNMGITEDAESKSTVNLADFSELSCKGNGKVFIQKGDANRVIMSSASTYTEDNGELKIDLNNEQIVLYVKQLKTMNISEKIEIEIENSGGQALTINLKDDANLKISLSMYNSLEINAFDNSELTFIDSEITKANASMNNYTVLTFENTRCANFNLLQNDKSELKLQRNSKVNFVE